MPTHEVGASAHTRCSVMPTRNTDFTGHPPCARQSTCTSIFSDLTTSFNRHHVPSHLETWWSSDRDSHAPNARGIGSIPGQGTIRPHAKAMVKNNKKTFRDMQTKLQLTKVAVNSDSNSGLPQCPNHHGRYSRDRLNKGSATLHTHPIKITLTYEMQFQKL